MSVARLVTTTFIARLVTTTFIASTLQAGRAEVLCAFGVRMGGEGGNALFELGWVGREGMRFWG